MVEFAGGTAAMLLLLLGVITLSGYQELQRRGSMAARQFAHESTWRADGEEPQVAAQRIYRLHFDDPGLLDAVGRARFVAPGDIHVTRQQGAAPGLAAEALSLLLTPLEVSRPFTGRNIQLETGGYVNGELTARVVPHEWTPDPFRGLELELRQPYAILSDAWNSGSPRQVRERTSSLVPTQRLASFSAVWQGLAAPLSIIEPSIGRLCLGLIEPDTVPEDRLGPRVRGANAGRICQ